MSQGIKSRQADHGERGIKDESEPEREKAPLEMHRYLLHGPKLKVAAGRLSVQIQAADKTRSCCLMHEKHNRIPHAIETDISTIPHLK